MLDKFIIEFMEIEKGKVKIIFNDKQVGNDLTDNNYVDDGYRYHDVMHLTNSAIIGWSPVTRWLLGYKDSGKRAVQIEEQISAMSFGLFYHNRYLSDSHIKFVQLYTKGFFIPRRYWWIESLDIGIGLVETLHRNKGGQVEVNINKNTIKIL